VCLPVVDDLLGNRATMPDSVISSWTLAVLMFTAAKAAVSPVGAFAADGVVARRRWARARTATMRST